MSVESVNLESKVVAVTVYPDRARVQRRGSCPVSAKTRRVVLENLPLTMVRESVRVAGSGSVPVRILGVDVRRAFFEKAPVARVRELEQAIEKVRDERRVITDRQAGLQAHLGYLEGLRSETRYFARGLARGESSVEDQGALLSFLAEQDGDVRAQLRAADAELRVVDDRLQKLEAELKQVRNSQPRERHEAVVEVEAGEAGELTVELSYVVHSAGWTPLYDVRLVEARRVQLTYLAQVQQRTGEDWSARITVSTARPALNQRIPDLRPWYVDERRPLVTRGAASPMLADMDAMPEAEELVRSRKMAAPAPMQSVQAEIATAEAGANGLAVSYTLPGTLDVPSDGTPHKGVIGNFELEPSLDYVAVPRHTDAVYRRVTVRNETPGPLLAGQANLFVDDEFIGATQVDYTPGGDELELLLGVEERITISRELARRDVDKRFLRDLRQLNYAYEIELENLLDRPVEVVVRDQIPVSRHESIQVRLTDANPQPAEQSELNLLRWEVKIEPGAERNITYAYQIEHPRQMNVAGLVD